MRLRDAGAGSGSQDLRWDIPGPRAAGEEFTLNHNYVPWLTRLLLDEFPEAGGLVRIKRGKHVDG